MSGCIIETEIVIRRPPEVVFDYVSKPWRWHEWHPGSQWAQRGPDLLEVGQRFTEVAAMRPVRWLPFRLSSALKYVVHECERPRIWEVRGTSPRIDLRIRYELEEASGTRFKRMFEYLVKGAMATVEPVLLRPRMKAQSVQALTRLKKRLESTAGAH